MKELSSHVSQYFARPLSDSVNVRVLAVASTAENIAVPSGARYVLLSANADFYARADATAAVPAADVTDGTGSELNPTTLQVVGVTNISVVSGTAGAIVTAAFYS